MKKLNLFLAAIVLVLSLSFYAEAADQTGCIALDKYFIEKGYPPYSAKARDIGILKGSWYDMGKQYGERAGDLIRLVFDAWFKSMEKAHDSKHILDDLKRYNKQIEYLAPQLIDFMKGISDGAAKELARSPYRNVSHYEKILFINCQSPMERRHPPQAAHYPLPACNAFAFYQDGQAIVIQNRDVPTFPYLYEITYTTEPSDPKAHKTWTLTTAGMIMANMIVNDKGVTVCHNTGGNAYKTEQDFGVSWVILYFYAGTYANSGKEAVEIETVGTPEYRAKTGRKTMLRTGDSASLIADRGEAFIVESTAHRYAVRRPGDLGEAGKYIGVANNFYMNYSYNEENQRTTAPEYKMTAFGDDESDLSRSRRFWTWMWLAKYKYGKVTPEVVMRDFAPAEYYIMKDGTRVDHIWRDGKWLPVKYAGSTIPDNYWGSPEICMGGTMDSKVVVLTDNTIYWTLGRASDWKGKWDSTKLE